MTAIASYANLPPEAQKHLKALEVYIGDTDGKDTVMWCSEPPNTCVDDGTIDAGEAVTAFNGIVAALTAVLSDQVVVPNPAAEFVMWALLTGSWQGDDIDGGAAQDKAVELGLIVETTYDPAIHGESVYCSPGDSWYVPSEKLLAMLPAPASTAGEVGK